MASKSSIRRRQNSYHAGEENLYPWESQQIAASVGSNQMQEVEILTDQMKAVDSLNPALASVFGVQGLVGNAGEMTISPFQPLVSKLNYHEILNEFKDEVEKVIKKRSLEEIELGALNEVEWHADDRVVKGATFAQGASRELALIAFRSQFRFAQNRQSFRKFIGFRLAKSQVPGRDALITSIELDPKLQQAQDARIFSSQAEGVERYIFNEKGNFQAYRTVSFAPSEMIFDQKNLREFNEASLLSPVLVGVLYSTETLETPQLNPGFYRVYYRHKGIPDRLNDALRAGSVRQWDQFESSGKTERPEWLSVFQSYGITKEQLASEGKSLKSYYSSSLNGRINPKKSGLYFISSELDLGSNRDVALPFLEIDSVNSTSEPRSGDTLAVKASGKTIQMNSVIQIHSRTRVSYEEYLDRYGKAPRGSSYLEFEFSLQPKELF